ncbi:unnamed protein product, partial [Discosporangium mesarthrocarpum]
DGALRKRLKDTMRRTFWDRLVQSLSPPPPPPLRGIAGSSVALALSPGSKVQVRYGSASGDFYAATVMRVNQSRTVPTPDPVPDHACGGGGRGGGRGGRGAGGGRGGSRQGYGEGRHGHEGYGNSGSQPRPLAEDTGILGILGMKDVEGQTPGRGTVVEGEREG